MKKKRTSRQYAAALYELAHSAKGEKLNAILKKFVEILARDRRLKKIDNIVREYEKYSQKQARITALTICSARELSKGTLDKIDKAFGGKTEIATTIEPKLLGGIKIKTEDKILDASLIKQLTRLSRVLSS